MSSIVRPSSANGVVGIKPTVGLLSRTGVMPVAAPQDNVGPMARTVADVALLLTVLAGPDPEDPATLVKNAPKSPDFLVFLAEDAVRGARLGVARDLMGTHEGVDKVLNAQGLDALIAPTDGTPPWVIDPLVGDHIIGGCSAPPAMAGYPHVTVPAGTCHGLPVALSFFGPAWQDGKLLGYAYAFEQATRARCAPTFKETVA